MSQLNESYDQLGVSLEIASLSGDELGTSLQDASKFSFQDTLSNNDRIKKASPFDFVSSDSELEELLIEENLSSTPVKGFSGNKGMASVLLPSPLKKTPDQKLAETSLSQNVAVLTETSRQLNTSTPHSENRELSKYKERNLSATGGNIMLNKALDTTSDAIRISEYCPNSCLHGLAENGFKISRYKFWTKTYQLRVEWLLDKFDEATDVQGEYFFTASFGKNICSKCFSLLYRIPKNFYYLCLNKHSDGLLSTSNKHNRKKSKMYEGAQTWLQQYAEFYGDRMPHRNETHLPYHFKRIAVYRKYENDKIEELRTHLARSTFMKMWQKEFEWLKVRKTNTFSKCDKCTGLDRQMEMTRDPKQRASLKQLVDCHNEHQKGEREYYRYKRELARMYPERYLSLIIDGMDQAKTNLPHFTGRQSKCLDASYILKTHVQGVINHGDDIFHTFLDLNEYSHDPNMVVNTILKVLYYRFEKCGKLPNVMFLQADNCFRENKNKYVLAFLELLVRLEIFTEVQLSFLYVGHTHEDIDARFGIIAEELRKKDAITLPQLKSILPNIQELKGLYDFKGWVESHLNTIQNHSKPLHFMFKRSAHDEVEGYYKGQHNHPWIALGDHVLIGTPTGTPALLKPPYFHKIDFKELKKTVDRCQHIITDPSSRNWWERFIGDMQEIQEDEAKLLAYATDESGWVLPKLPKQKPEDQTLDVASTHIQEMLDQEFDIPCVKIRKRAAPVNAKSNKRNKKDGRNVSKQK